MVAAAGAVAIGEGPAVGTVIVPSCLEAVAPVGLDSLVGCGEMAEGGETLAIVQLVAIGSTWGQTVDVERICDAGVGQSVVAVDNPQGDASHLAYCGEIQRGTCTADTVQRYSADGCGTYLEVVDAARQVAPVASMCETQRQLSSAEVAHGGCVVSPGVVGQRNGVGRHKGGRVVGVADYTDLHVACVGRIVELAPEADRQVLWRAANVNLGQHRHSVWVVAAQRAAGFHVENTCAAGSLALAVLPQAGLAVEHHRSAEIGMEDIVVALHLVERFAVR